MLQINTHHSVSLFGKTLLTRHGELSVSEKSLRSWLRFSPNVEILAMSASIVEGEPVTSVITLRASMLGMTEIISIMDCPADLLNAIHERLG